MEVVVEKDREKNCRTMVDRINFHVNDIMKDKFELVNHLLTSHEGNIYIHIRVVSCIV